MKTFNNYNGQRFDHYVKQVSRFTQMLEVNPNDSEAKRLKALNKTDLFRVMQIMQDGNKVKA